MGFYVFPKCHLRCNDLLLTLYQPFRPGGSVEESKLLYSGSYSVCAYMILVFVPSNALRIECFQSVFRLHGRLWNFFSESTKVRHVCVTKFTWGWGTSIRYPESCIESRFGGKGARNIVGENYSVVLCGAVKDSVCKTGRSSESFWNWLSKASVEAEGGCFYTNAHMKRLFFSCPRVRPGNKFLQFAQRCGPVFRCKQRTDGTGPSNGNRQRCSHAWPNRKASSDAHNSTMPTGGWWTKSVKMETDGHERCNIRKEKKIFLRTFKCWCIFLINFYFEKFMNNWYISSMMWRIHCPR